jgi:hypothetical protein
VQLLADEGLILAQPDENRSVIQHLQNRSPTPTFSGLSLSPRDTLVLESSPPSPTGSARAGAATSLGGRMPKRTRTPEGRP